MTGLGVALPYSIFYILKVYFPSTESANNFLLTDRIGVTWMTLAFLIAFGIAVYQYIKIKDSLSRNQLRVVVLGSLFGLFTPMTLAIFYTFSIPWENILPISVDASQGIGSIIMIVCLLIAIFRYRIWDTEIFIRRALLYMSATLVITLSYLLLLFFFERMTIGETNLTRFIILAVAVIVFLALRDRIQHLIDRLFHRENYDSATVVSDFEEKLAGIYLQEELKSGIAKGLDDIFHFKSMVFYLKKDELLYEPVYSLGLDQTKLDKEYKVPVELEIKLKKSRVFAPAEIDQNISMFDIANGELIVPL